jgi:hypothetical protein
MKLYAYELDVEMSERERVRERGCKSVTGLCLMYNWNHFSCSRVIVVASGSAY